MALRFPNNLPVDGARLRLKVSDVSPVTEWKDNRPTGNQARDTDGTGFPLWAIEVKFSDVLGEAVGRSEVVVPLRDRPLLDDGEVVEFDDLAVYFWAGKAGLAGRFSATDVRSVVSATKVKTGNGSVSTSAATA